MLVLQSYSMPEFPGGAWLIFAAAGVYPVGGWRRPVPISVLVTTRAAAKHALGHHPEMTQRIPDLVEPGVGKTYASFDHVKPTI